MYGRSGCLHGRNAMVNSCARRERPSTRQADDCCGHRTATKARPLFVRQMHGQYAVRRSPTITGGKGGSAGDRMRGAAGTRVGSTAPCRANCQLTTVLYGATGAPSRCPRVRHPLPFGCPRSPARWPDYTRCRVLSDARSGRQKSDLSPTWSVSSELSGSHC